ncbi:MAG TPA: slipin family protein [Candidatus Dormibacteraeota bacterium]|nr:slipin family protein [Candidatus Dormibacteraeota bacterium]
MDWLPFAVLVLVVAGVAALVYWRPAQVTVFEFERALRYRSGRFAGELGPGHYWYSSRFGRVTKVDVRPATVTVPGQELITADGIGVKVSVLATIEVADAVSAINKIQNFMQAVYATVQIALREEISSMTIENLLADRSSLGQKILERAAPALAEIGVTLRTADVRDVMLPGDLKRVFAQELAARKEGAAALEKARGETAALRNLANAARMVQDNPALYQLRLLQQLGATGGNTVVLGQADTLPVRPAPRPRTRGESPAKPEEPG